MNKPLVLLLGTALVSGIAYWLLRPAPAPEMLAVRPPVAVVVEAARRDRFQDMVEALGTTFANESVAITAKQTERVATVHFDDGQLVEKDQLLVQLDSAAEAAELELARAELREYQREYNRIRDLVRRQQVAELELDRLASQKEQAQARISRARARLEERTIRAPFAGLLGLRRVSPGTLVTPGDMITTLDDIHLIKLDFTIPERYLAALNVGDTVRATSRARPDFIFSGRVEIIAPRVDPTTRSVTVRALIDNPQRLLRPGMLMKVELIYDSRETLLIPEEAIFSLRKQHFVYRLDADNIVAQQVIELGGRRPGEVEVLSGLDEGDQVITRGRFKVRDGQQVEVQTEAWRGEG